MVKVLGASRSPKQVLHAGLADKQNAKSVHAARQLTLKSGMGVFVMFLPKILFLAIVIWCHPNRWGLDQNSGQYKRQPPDSVALEEGFQCVGHEARDADGIAAVHHRIGAPDVANARIQNELQGIA
jgi:hypothetical protein